MFGNLKYPPDWWRCFSPPHRCCQSPSHPKSTPLAVLAWHSYVTRAILALQLHGGNTSPCYCEAGIAVLGVPRANFFAPVNQNYVRWHNFHHCDHFCVLDKEIHHHPWQKDPHSLCKTPPNASWPSSSVSGVRTALRNYCDPSKKYQQFRVNRT